MPARPWHPDRFLRTLRVVRSGAFLAGFLAWGSFAFPTVTAVDPPSSRAADTGSGSDSFRIAVDVPLVMLTAAVRDARGKPVLGLEAGNFRLYDDGLAQEIRFFRNEDVPATIGLVVDASLCMRPVWGQVLGATLAFLQHAHPLDEFFVVVFSDRPRFILPDDQPFTSSVATLRAGLLRLPRPDGETALYDAVLAALDHSTRGRWDKRALMIIGDGEDNASRSTLEEAVRTIQASGSTVFAIGVADEIDDDRNPAALRRLAEVSGGESYWPASQAKLPDFCARISREFRRRYLVGYLPPPGDPGSFRQLRLEVVAPGRKGLSVQTRPGYRVPNLPAPPNDPPVATPDPPQPPGRSNPTGR